MTSETKKSQGFTEEQRQDLLDLGPEQYCSKHGITGKAIRAYRTAYIRNLHKARHDPKDKPAVKPKKRQKFPKEQRRELMELGPREYCRRHGITGRAIRAYETAYTRNKRRAEPTDGVICALVSIDRYAELAAKRNGDMQSDVNLLELIKDGLLETARLEGRLEGYKECARDFLANRR